MSQSNEDEGACLLLRAITGRDGDPMTKGELRTVTALVHRYHWQPTKTKIDQVHAALYDPDNGFVPTVKSLQRMRLWLFTAATWAAAVVIGGITLLDRLHVIGLFR